eukprot:scaffold592302_cov45-Prasinocladus_malaysianus.AAC.1
MPKFLHKLGDHLRKLEVPEALRDENFLIWKRQAGLAAPPKLDKNVAVHGGSAPSRTGPARMRLGTHTSDV